MSSTRRRTASRNKTRTPPRTPRTPRTPSRSSYNPLYSCSAAHNKSNTSKSVEEMKNHLRVCSETLNNLKTNYRLDDSNWMVLQAKNHINGIRNNIVRLTPSCKMCFDETKKVSNANVKNPHAIKIAAHECNTCMKTAGFENEKTNAANNLISLVNTYKDTIHRYHPHVQKCYQCRKSNLSMILNLLDINLTRYKQATNLNWLQPYIRCLMGMLYDCETDIHYKVHVNVIGQSQLKDFILYLLWSINFQLHSVKKTHVFVVTRNLSTMVKGFIKQLALEFSHIN